MKVSTTVTERGVVIVEIQGDVDAYTAPRLDKALKELLAQGHSRVVLDASQLEYISSAGLRVILKATKRLKGADDKLVLCAMKDYIKEVFEISGFDQFLPIVPSVDDALRQD